MRRRLAIAFILSLSLAGPAGALKAEEPPFVLEPGRVFDGIRSAPHDGWVVVVQGNTIAAAGPKDAVAVPKGARVIALPETTLLPGLIDAHSHVLLHAYDETPWNDQV